jgi:osmotically-inducible protein OsmY
MKVVDDSQRQQSGVSDPTNGEMAADGPPENSQDQSWVGDAGAGPSSPADRKLSEQVIQCLRATGYLSLRELSIFSADGVVILKGRVPSYYLKQVVHCTVRDLPGVGEVRDYVEVSVPK